MRLLDTKTLGFQEFDDPPSKYAILSHRWGEKEVTYKEMKEGSAPPGPGLEKVHRFCRLAANNGIEWAWIDTCCIDKRSSAELSGAINSMYKWYKDATRCYIYLGDVDGSIEDGDEHLRYNHRLVGSDGYRRDGSLLERLYRLRRHRLKCERGRDWRETFERQIVKSSWFTRGWTLQELLAPHLLSVYFLEKNWKYLGNLQDLAEIVSEITGIDGRYLGSDTPAWNPWSSAYPSVATRMSWMSRRKTSRGEDIAYCMMGMFYSYSFNLYTKITTRDAICHQQCFLKVVCADQTASLL